MAQTVFYNGPGVGRFLNVSDERGRQLFKTGAIPTVALLNGTTPLVDRETLEAIAAERARRSRGAGESR